MFVQTYVRKRSKNTIEKMSPFFIPFLDRFFDLRWMIQHSGQLMLENMNFWV